ncbi:MAG: tetratricopeptide repeat protein, partial [Kiritimatiellales bacterium]
MKKHLFGVTAGIILWLTGWAYGQTIDPVLRLGQARLLVEQKQYPAALEVYTEIESWLWRDPGLVVEMARVQTYTDRHAEAIRLFEAVRNQHPEKQYEFLADLADQYCWNGQAKEAEPVFRDALKHNPHDLRSRLGLARALRWSDRPKAAVAEYDLVLAAQPANIEALNGKADALSRIDHLEEAIRLFQQVTAIDLHNVEALNGIARCRVWQGYHRQGRDLYLAILNEFPGNIDALEGLAFAQHWYGRDDQANQTLGGLIAAYPERPSGQQLHREIKYAQEPVVTQENRYRKDKYGNSTQQHGLRAGFHLDKVTTLEAIYDWRRFRDRDNPDMDVNRAGIGGGHKFSDLVELNSFWYANDYDYADVGNTAAAQGLDKIGELIFDAVKAFSDGSWAKGLGFSVLALMRSVQYVMKGEFLGWGAEGTYKPKEDEKPYELTPAAKKMKANQQKGISSDVGVNVKELREEDFKEWWKGLSTAQQNSYRDAVENHNGEGIDFSGFASIDQGASHEE